MVWRWHCAKNMGKFNLDVLKQTLFSWFDIRMSPHGEKYIRLISRSVAIGKFLLKFGLQGRNLCNQCQIFGPSDANHSSRAGFSSSNKSIFLVNIFSGTKLSLIGCHLLNTLLGRERNDERVPAQEISLTKLNASENWSANEILFCQERKSWRNIFSMRPFSLQITFRLSYKNFDLLNQIDNTSTQSRSTHPQSA